jgi:hypothetical protein
MRRNLRPQQCNDGPAPMAIELLIAVQTKHLLSHDGESFFGCGGIQASANGLRVVQMISARKIFLLSTPDNGAC